MTYNITTFSFRESYSRIVHDVQELGHRTDSRLSGTIELMPATIVVHPRDDGKFDTLTTGIGRGISTRIAAVEATMMMGMFADPGALLAVAPQFAAYADGGNFYGNYGQRIRPQMPAVIDRLHLDPTTRQAQVVIWDPALDLAPDIHDYPCTTYLRFYIREGKLEMHAGMRSNDVWRGLPYDVFVFTQVQQMVAHVLGVPCGRYVHHASSLHLYDSDASEVTNLRPREDVVTRTEGDPHPFRMNMYPGKRSPSAVFQDEARTLRDTFGAGKNNAIMGLPINPDGWAWFAERYPVKP